MAIVTLNTPFDENEIRKLKIGDSLYINGTVVLMRDEGHERALKFFKEGKALPFDIKGLAVFHCGPIVEKKGDEWKFLSAGPTTSMRMELFEDEMIKNYGIRVVVGKGGMGERTAKAMKEYGAVFAAFTGGAGVLLPAKSIKKVKEVHWLDFGTPEAFWVIEVEKFGPLTIGMDSHGESLYKKVNEEVERNKEKVYKFLGV
jgi:fumarate hydratase subunit beta